MKRSFLLIILVILSLLLNGCEPSTKPERIINSLSIYSEDEVNVAMDIVERYFKKNFRECELKSIEYDEKFYSYSIDYYSSLYDVSKSNIMYLKTEFFGEDGEEDFRECILVRNDYGKWKVKDCGYP